MWLQRRVKCPEKDAEKRFRVKRSVCGAKVSADERRLSRKVMEHYQENKKMFCKDVYKCLFRVNSLTLIFTSSYCVGVFLSDA